MIIWPGLAAAAGAIPSTPVRDTFTDTNGTLLPTHDSRWTATLNNCDIQSNACAGTVAADSNWCSWNEATYGPDCESYCTITVNPGTGWMTINARQTTTASATADGYQGGVDFNVATDVIEIYELLDGAGTLLNSVAFEINANDVLTFRAVGSALKLYVNGVLQLETADATYRAAGYIAILVGDTNVRLDTFGGGTL